MNNSSKITDLPTLQRRLDGDIIGLVEQTILHSHAMSKKCL